MVVGWENGTTSTPSALTQATTEPLGDRLTYESRQIWVLQAGFQEPRFPWGLEKENRTGTPPTNEESWVVLKPPFICMCVCMYVCMYVCIYIYICIQYTPLSVDKWLVLCAPGNFIYFWLFRDLSNRTYSSTTRPANSSKSHITSYNVIWSASGCNWQRCNSNQLGQSWLTLWFWSSFMGLNHCNHSSLKFWQAWGAWGVH